MARKDFLKLAYHAPDCYETRVLIRAWDGKYSAISIRIVNHLEPKSVPKDIFVRYAFLTPEMAIEMANKVQYGLEQVASSEILMERIYKPTRIYHGIRLRCLRNHGAYKLLLELHNNPDPAMPDFINVHTPVDFAGAMMDEEAGTDVSLALRLAAIYADTSRVYLDNPIT